VTGESPCISTAFDSAVFVQQAGQNPWVDGADDYLLYDAHPTAVTHRRHDEVLDVDGGYVGGVEVFQADRLASAHWTARTKAISPRQDPLGATRSTVPSSWRSPRVRTAKAAKQIRARLLSRSPNSTSMFPPTRQPRRPCRAGVRCAAIRVPTSTYGPAVSGSRRVTSDQIGFLTRVLAAQLLSTSGGAPA
jgi:hypothetical protein